MAVVTDVTAIVMAFLVKAMVSIAALHIPLGVKVIEVEVVEL